MTIDHREWAEYLLDAADRKLECKPISTHIGAFSIDDAYDIQDALLALRVARGEKIVGAKLGLTSIAKQQQMNVSEPCYGWVTDASILHSDEVPVGELIHPRVEPEFVFTLNSELSGSTLTAGDVLDATSVLGGIEVIDSRYEAFSFTLPDVVADNTSAARVRLGGGAIGGRSVDLTTAGCTFRINGEVSATATGAALLGDPAECVAMLVRHLHKRGKQLEAGWTVLGGAATDAKPLGVGATASVGYSHVPVVSVRGI